MLQVIGFPKPEKFKATYSRSGFTSILTEVEFIYEVFNVNICVNYLYFINLLFKTMLKPGILKGFNKIDNKQF